MSMIWIADNVAVERAEESLGRQLKALLQRLCALSFFVLAVAAVLFFYGFPVWASLQTITALPLADTDLLKDAVWGLSILITVVATLSLPASLVPARRAPVARKR